MSTGPRFNASSPSTRDDADTRAFAIAVARLANENKSEAVHVLDLRGLSTVADYFVIGTGTSDRQMRAVLDAIEDHARSVGRVRFTVTDRGTTSWMLADYVDVVIHLFDEEHREYYDLDSLWGDAPEVVWQDSENGTEPPAGSDQND